MVGKVPPRSRLEELTKSLNMKYFEEIDAWLDTLLEGPVEDEFAEEWSERAKEAIKAKLLESYLNGKKVGAKPTPETKPSESAASERPKSRWPQRPVPRKRAE